MLQSSHALLLSLALGAASANAAGWNFVQNGTSGILALEAMIVSPTLAIFFDRASNDPLMINNAPAWGALWNLETNTASPLRVISDTFCASGGFLSNGTMVSVGGNIPAITAATDGRMAIRIFEPCADPAGLNCTLFEDPETLHLEETRWYPSSLRIFDGSLMIVGGIHERTPFYNTDPVNNFEFFPPKDGGVPRPSEFLARSLPANLFPRVFGLPDGRVLMVANNQTIIYDIEKNTETILPDIPNGVRVTNPFDGSATLLPLSPPLYTPEVLVCGGTTTSDLIQPANLSSQDPASDQCSRLTITSEGIKKGWQVEKMLEARIMPELLLLPNGQVLIVNGGQTGYAAFDTVPDPVGFQSNADHPAPALGQRISNKVMPTTDIPRVYHSVASLTPKGKVVFYASITERPVMSNVPAKIGFNKRFTINVSVPKNLKANSIQGVFFSNLVHTSRALIMLTRSYGPRLLLSRLPLEFEMVFMDAQLSQIVGLCPLVYPPGPAYIFVTIDDVTSAGAQVMVGSGAPPPVADQGLPNQF
ncbi:hypothetical protein BDZ97DRAFT_2057679 [Flammula alnicola]|nr:hypothetical protein BDZ97DRAFT_2057679 [Flammula alnicola]